MTYTFGDISRALEAMFGIPERSRTAFTARLKHFQKLGFPPGTNTGRGHAAAYRAEHAFMLALALELSQVGHTPERSIALVDKIFFGAIEAIPCILPVVENAEKAFHIIIRSRVLTYSLTRSKILPIGMLSVNQGDPFPQWILDDRSVTTLNLNTLLRDLTKYMAAVGSAEFMDELIAWATEQTGADKNVLGVETKYGHS